MCNNIEPLSPTLWFQRVAVIAAGELGSVENSLRHAGHLIQLAPISFKKVLPTIEDDGAFEAILESEDLDAAARQLIGPNSTMLIEASAHGGPLRAVIACSDLGRTIDGSGDTVASAVLRAWANWLIALRVEFGAEFEDHPSPTVEWHTPQCKSACPGAG